MAKITDTLKDIKLHLLTCIGLYQCGYENVRQLQKDLSGYDPTGSREFADVRFSDMLGNYFWIEKASEVSVIGAKRLDNCGGSIQSVSQRFTLYSMVKGADEYAVFECIMACLGGFGCDLNGVKVSIAGGDYDSIAVLKNALPEKLHGVIAKIANFAVTKIDLRIEYLILPNIKPGGEGCECEACNDC